MCIDSHFHLFLLHMRQLYMAKPLREITTGNSGDRIFEVEAASRPYILRVSKFTEKKQAHTKFELGWVDYLAARMEGIAKPVRSVNRRLYEVVKAGNETYIMSLQEKVPGKLVNANDPKEFNEDLFYNLGMLMGHMHRLTMDYDGNKPCSEFKWNGPHFWRKDIDILDKAVQQGEQRFLKALEQLPAGKENYGIVHFDIHTDNFLIDNNKIILIDFDACQFNWYAADMASALFFMVQKGAGPLKNLSETMRTEFAETYLTAYLKGYVQTNSIRAYWIKKLDLFMRYQMIDEYVASQLGWPEQPDLRQKNLDWHRNRIQKNLPYVNINYEKIINSL